jgi:teichuronic acid biosynthesis glycosyltransferase TuaG
MNHLVSVITPIYNSERYLQECIESVQKQSYTNFEHILVDDCSTDNSVGIVKKFSKKDSRIKLLKLKKNSGAGVARNKGVEIAEGRFIAFLDADDFWSGDKLKDQLEMMVKTGHALSYTSYYVVDDASKPKYRRKVPLITDYQSILRNCYIFCSTAIYDTKQLGKVYMPKIRRRQDWVLWINILKVLDKSIGLQKPLVYYREGNDSLSKNKIKLLKDNFNVYRQQLGFSYFISLIFMIRFLITYFSYKIRSRTNL